MPHPPGCCCCCCCIAFASPQPAWLPGCCPPQGCWFCCPQGVGCPPIPACWRCQSDAPAAGGALVCFLPPLNRKKATNPTTAAITSAATAIRTGVGIEERNPNVTNPLISYTSLHCR